MEYISREAALQAQNKSMNLAECRKRLERIPAADVAPVRHGRWEWSEDGWWHKCSSCGVTFDYDKTYELFDHGFQLANYCPCCGARMDGDGDV